jgi:signal recognition particle GTPase
MVDLEMQCCKTNQILQCISATPLQNNQILEKQRKHATRKVSGFQLSDVSWSRLEKHEHNIFQKMMLHADKRKHERKHFSENGTRC